MARPVRHSSVSARRPARSPLAPISVGVGCFAIVCAALFVFSRQGTSTPQPTAPVVQNTVPPTEPVVAVTPPAVETPAAAPVETVAADPSVVLAKRVEGHLAAGEFGPAVEAAMTTQDAWQQAKLLKQVALAQVKAGEFEAALATVRRAPQAPADTAQTGLAGGGAFPDFSELIYIIQNNTSGTWEDVDGTGGSMSQSFNGVRVAPNGLLERITEADRKGELQALGLRARVADLNDDMARPSSLRLVSLTRLEQAVAQRLAAGQPIPETMAQLAGLSKIQYVFLYPEEREVVIGGPAESWRYNDEGLPLGVNSNRPTLQLDDFVTVLRCFAEGHGDFGCSINTRDEGVRALKEYVEASLARGPISAGAVRGWVNQLQRKLGMQDIVVWGIPADSRVARVLVEADYRMKLIGIGKLNAKEIPSYFELLPLNLQKDPPAMDALRWWLTLQCDRVLHSPDRNVFQIQGSSVLCQSENQMLTADGKHVPTGKAEATNRLFAQNFTTNYERLAEHDLAFADTRNVFDLALVAALVRQEREANRIGWNFGVFAPGGTYHTAAYPVPKEVESVVNHRVYNGKDIVVQVAGGVRADVASVLKDQNVVQPAERLTGLNAKAHAPQLPEGRWWWDAAE